MTNVKKLSEIEAAPIKRNRTWFPDLDLLYGTNNLPEHNIGMPKGKISLWAGERGTGKSRLCIDVSKKFVTNYYNGVVLYFQTESPLSDFASWVKDTTQYDRIYCSGEDHIDEIIKIIYQIKPQVVIIDSVNEIEEFETGNKQEARRLIKGSDGKPGLKQVANDTGAHIILLGQINQDGKTIKGGTSLPHLVDIEFYIKKTENKGIFKVEVGSKHRHGPGDTVAYFRHTDAGVEEYKVIQTPVVQTSQQQRAYGYLNKSGSVPLNREGFPIVDSPEFIEHMDIYRNLPENIPGLLDRLNRKVGRFFGK